jgi:hypothetical protein
MLLTQIKDMINVGIKRQAIRSCSSWSENYRVMGSPIPGPFTFKYHPWLKEMHDSEAIENIGQKSAQMGYTECCLNRTFYHIDVKRVDCLYVLPSKSPDATDFSAARFGVALELSTHLQNLFSDVENVGHKRAGSVNLYIRGSRSRGGLKSIPVGFMVLDEYDEMDEKQVVLAVERMSGQFYKQIWKVSTATLPKFGINKEFLRSTQEHFFFPCPSCSRFIELTLENLVVATDNLMDPKIHESHLKCVKCGNKLDHVNKHEYLGNGKWVQSIATADPDVRGFYINQLYSSTVSPVEMARAYLKAQMDPSEEQEFYNSKMGQAHFVDGAKISDEDIQKCTRNYGMLLAGDPKALITMGIDVGSWLHYEICEWQVPSYVDVNTNAQCRVIKVGKVRHFEELDSLMAQYQVKGCVIDKQPEARKAKEFADRFYGYVKLCHYGRGISSKTIQVKSEDNEIVIDHQINVDRTSWLDQSLGRIMSGKIDLPHNLPEEYKEHLKNQARQYEKDADGNPTGKYVSLGPDHYGHARNYSEIALLVALSKTMNADIGAFL